MASKFIAFIPAQRNESDFIVSQALAENFYSQDQAKVWAGRQMLANPKIDEVYIYQIRSKVRFNRLLAEHTEVVDLT